MSKKQQRQGKQGEQFAENKLRSFGVCNLAKIPTPKIVTRSGDVRYTSKVLGDRRGELENGISVLAEIKTTRNKDRLTWSCFSKSKGEKESRQPKNLDNHKGLSLLVWVCETDWTQDIFVMDWQELKRAGFAPGRGIGVEDADKIAMTQADFDNLAEQRIHVSPDTIAPF